MSRRLGRFCNSSFQLAALKVVSYFGLLTAQSEPIGDIRFALVSHGFGLICELFCVGGLVEGEL